MVSVNHLRKPVSNPGQYLLILMCLCCIDAMVMSAWGKANGVTDDYMVRLANSPLGDSSVPL